MGRRCCVQGCHSNSRFPEHRGVTFHTIPLDPVIRQIWMRNCRINAEKQITKSVLVCSRHFRRADFLPQRGGKYLLKQRVFPTVFSWAKLDPAQMEAELTELKAATSATTVSNEGATTTGSSAVTAPIGQGASTATSNDDEEDTTKATVEAKVAQIMAEAAELNASAKGESADGGAAEKSGETHASYSGGSMLKFEAVTAFNPGARLEAQDFAGVWHTARIAEVDNDDREVLIRFERSSSKTKAAPTNTEEWIPMNSSRLRQKVAKCVPVFKPEEKCMARWSGPRKFPGTVKKVLDNDTYEILFDDGYVKNVRAVHMNKYVDGVSRTSSSVPSLPATPEPIAVEFPASTSAQPIVAPIISPVPSAKSNRKDNARLSGGKSARKRVEERKDWKLLDVSKLDLASLNLPDIPRDGEWTCHWVNDQPIGSEGFLVVGEHRKPTVIVEDWRLPPGWVKHMYQRSNLLGKWDVILVSPTNKRFRSKADLKVYLEEINERYNPDVYDFSIHRRRAKDINAYAFTPDYTPQQMPKPKTQLETTLAALPAPAKKTPSAPTSTPNLSLTSTPTLLSKSLEYMETPVATPMPPMELLTSPTPPAKSEPPLVVDTPIAGTLQSAIAPVDDGYAYIGGLKVQIVDNLFRCPQEGCLKNFRKENHLQIHVKHYHQGLIKLVGQCPKMQELAEKRTHPTRPEPEHTPRNQMSNQEFFAKLHQQDVQHSRVSRKHPTHTSPGTMASTPMAASPSTPTTSKEPGTTVKKAFPAQSPTGSGPVTADDVYDANKKAADIAHVEGNIASPIANEAVAVIPITAAAAPTESSTSPSKRARLSPSKRISGSRKSNRQRTTKRYLTAAPPKAPLLMADNSFGFSDFDDQTRQSSNTTPEVRPVEAKKRKTTAALAVIAPETPLSSVDSPMTIESRSSPVQGPSSSETDGGAAGVSSLISQQQHQQQKPKQQQQPQQYIKENGEVIKIVRMRQEEIINCLCGYGEEDGLMIQCELCLCWQHGFCNGVDKEADVPENYVCYKCRNPDRGRSSTKHRHEQEWLYDGKLPVANYHPPNPGNSKTFQLLQKSHMLCGNLCELKQFMHSLRVKLSIARNRSHPKLYLWAHKWDDENMRVKIEKELAEMGVESDSTGAGAAAEDSDTKSKIKEEDESKEAVAMPNVPQPEAPIDPVECQHRLMEHIQIQQNLAMVMLNKIEKQVDELEQEDELPDFKFDDVGSVKEVLSAFMKDLEVVKHIAKVNQEAHIHKALHTMK